MKQFFVVLVFLIGTACLGTVVAKPDSGYQMPPEIMADLVDAPRRPGVAAARRQARPSPR